MDKEEKVLQKTHDNFAYLKNQIWDKFSEVESQVNIHSNRMNYAFIEIDQMKF